MQYFTKNSLYLLITAITITSCSTKNPYKKSNKVYKDQVHNYQKTLSNTKDTTLTESVIFLSNDTIVKDQDPLLSYKDTLSIKTASTLQDTITVEWISSVNFNLRKPNLIIIHHTAQDSLAQTLKTFTSTKPQVSAHYVIGRDGKIVQMINDYLRAWHAGTGSWGKNTDINSSSIGIELDNNGLQPFSDNQITSLLALLSKLKKNYNIPSQNIIGHSDIAPGRKRDPSQFFPWKVLAANGFGLWPDEVLQPAPVNFNTEQALRIIGYNTKNLDATIFAFKLHYIQTDIDTGLDQKTINTIYNIYTKQ